MLQSQIKASLVLSAKDVDMIDSIKARKISDRNSEETDIKILAKQEIKEISKLIKKRARDGWYHIYYGIKYNMTRETLKENGYCVSYDVNFTKYLISWGDEE